MLTLAGSEFLTSDDEVLLSYCKTPVLRRVLGRGGETVPFHESTLCSLYEFGTLFTHNNFALLLLPIPLNLMFPPNSLAKGLDSLHNPLISHSAISSNMWRNAAKHACRGIRLHFHPPKLVTLSHASLFSPKTKALSDLAKLYCFAHDNFHFLFGAKGYSGVAEAVSSTDVEEDGTSIDEIQQLLLQEMSKEEQSQLVEEEDAPIDEIRELLQGMKKEKQKEVVGYRWQNQVKGVVQSRYQELRRRQVKIETEVWEEAAKEYRELLMDMCEQKLAPNLPYMKSLFLGWFEPLKDAIAKEQEMYSAGKNRTAYASYFVQLPADKMAVIAMHKLMGLLMTGTEHATIGTARVVQAACGIGDAIENEVRIHKFLEKTKKKKGDKSKKNEADESVADIKEEQKLRKKVIDLMKKQKLVTVRGLVKGQDDTKPWGTVIKTKVGSRLIELLLQTAYIQPPSDQMPDAAPDIRPAFVHSFKTVAKESLKTSRRYGIIQCDPLILKGLDRTAKNMVIPYMPMLVPPVNWTGYDKGGHLFLPSYVMRTHGVRQQREAVKRAPRKQLEPVFEALDTLGHMKWRVNKKVLSVVDRIWASGGRLADLVDRDDVPLPDEPDTDDEAKIKKWKWKVKSVQKENRERYSQRCDIELKLAVSFLEHYVH
ncbi:DNA-directed RNA polymerase 2, chloroplastic/mitochondrial, partial [Mucuna pruriens]